MFCPGTTDVALSVFVMVMAAVGVSVLVSEALLLSGLGSLFDAEGVTNALLVMEPVAVESMVPVTLNVAWPPAARSTGALMSPEPEAGQVDPGPVVAHVQVGAFSWVGMVSVTNALVANDGPRLETMMV